MSVLPTRQTGSHADVETTAFAPNDITSSSAMMFRVVDPGDEQRLFRLHHFHHDVRELLLSRRRPL